MDNGLGGGEEFTHNLATKKKEELLTPHNDNHHTGDNITITNVIINPMDHKDKAINWTPR